MPCYDHEFHEDRERAAEERDKLKLRVDELADLLCQACHAMEWELDIPESVWIWWQEHKKFDKQRGKK